MEEDEGHPGNGIHVAKDSDRQQRLRLCVLNEILNTERDYPSALDCFPPAGDFSVHHFSLSSYICLCHVTSGTCSL
ncbi:hypothetical protein GOODEAATRI_006058 [Goodea atripinnis]|uniref:Uncharacterized protein n=1 Tax=Goodea atripinnis TaxID=208336 RepID=A0ABV0MZ28_9TELE